MIRLISKKWPLVAAAGVFLVAAVHGEDLKPPAENFVTALSRPSKEVKPSFAISGIVTEVPVHEGDVVKAGQILAKQDDAQDRQDLDKLRLDAASMSEIEYDKADMAVKEIQAKRKHDMLKENVASPQEVEEADLQVALDRAKIEVSLLQHQVKGFDAAKQEIKVDRMQLRSPIDGKIQEIKTHQGEMATPDPSGREGAFTIIQNDPLWIEIPTLATSQAQQMKVGQELQTRYVGDKDWQAAKIIFIAPEADAKSDTQLVRLELPNPTGRDSGLIMQVKLPEGSAAVAAGNP